ncbi:MAG: Na/Pi cotransporter family protein, partial [Desulfuromonadaceae bacterium]|nr:Na/Pi cotransporter family protein [Desulfuromonadaceae bacterium]
TLLIKGHLTAESFHLQYLDSRVLNTPILALSQAQLETRRMDLLGQQVFDQTLLLLQGYDRERLRQMRQDEDALDVLQQEITDFLVKLCQQSITHDVSRQAAALMHIVNDLERLGDNCEDLRRLFVRRCEEQIEFSEAATDEMEDLVSRCRDFLAKTIASIDDSSKAQQLNGEERARAIREIEVELRDNHIQRLSTGECSTSQGLLFLDILHHIGKVGEHIGNIAGSVSADQ